MAQTCHTTILDAMAHFNRVTVLSCDIIRQRKWTMLDTNRDCCTVTPVTVVESRPEHALEHYEKTAAAALVQLN